VLDTIILLAGKSEQPALISALCKQNPRVAVREVETLADVAAIQQDVLLRARLIAFVTPVVVPACVLNQLGYGAYNFHPGPPDYPGWAASQFAVYNGATEFGATAHRMIERVDAGPIVAVERFAIEPDIAVDELEKLAFVHLAKIFWRLANSLTQSDPLVEFPIRWSGRKNTRRHYAALCDIPTDISEQELERRIKAFGGNHFGVTPAIKLHGRRFNLTSNDTPALQRQSELANQAAAASRVEQDHAA
jgi:methionyl-tRNA formyltransferase